MSLITRVFENTLAYRVIQAPFADNKLAPFLRHNDVRQIRRVLDVGCGPGTNTRYFTSSEYLGLDINERYIEHARRTYGKPFIVADVTKYQAPEGAKYDCVLLNSFLHHIGDADARRILEHLKTVLTPDGSIHILDLVLPNDLSIAHALARLDRGEHPRPLPQWRALFESCFEPVIFEPYPLRLAGRTLWNMVYFKGRVRA